MHRLPWIVLTLTLAGPAWAEGWPDLARPPAATGGGEKDAALVVGIEGYVFAPRVDGAADNARAWYAFLTRTRQVPASRSRLLLDADAALESLRKSLAEAAARVEPGGTLWLIFIGHGAPSEDGRDGVLVGVDAQQTVESLYARSMRQKEVLDLLAQGKQSQTIVVFDACFSGKGRNGESLAKGLQPMLPVGPKAYPALKKTVVLTAGSSQQFAGPLPGEARPAFSYLVLGALRGWGDANHDGQVTAAEAVAYANDALQATLKGRSQTPELHPSEGGGLVLARPRSDETGPNLADLAIGSSAPQPTPASGGPTVKGSAIREVVGDLTVATNVKAGVRLELRDPTGAATASGSPYKNDKAPVGKWTVAASAEGFEDLTNSFEVPPDDVTVIRLTLNPLGSLKIQGKPLGAVVRVTGPGFTNESGMPWEATNLKSGTYKVEIDRQGYRGVNLEVAVASGKPTVVEVDLEKLGQCPDKMIRIPGGTYTMAGKSVSTLVHDFCMDASLVTVDEYMACVRAEKCGKPMTYLGCNWMERDRQQRPMDCAYQGWAAEFCKLRGMRLPTEEEWEWAARGGPRGTRYPWGSEAPTQEYCVNEVGNAARDNPWGVHDLIGYWQWTTSPATSDLIRGGDCKAGAAGREVLGVQPLPSGIGFRCVKGLPQ